MTTIVATKDGMWADGRACSGSEIATNNAKKLFENEDYIYGGAGDFASITEAMAYITAAEDDEEYDEPEKEIDFTLIRLEKQTGKICICNKQLVWLEVRSPYAIGSGSSYALGALSAGADAKTALKIAMSHDAATGGKIRHIKR